MPLGDGFTVCEELKGNPEFADIPVLMITSFSQRVGETTLAVSRGLAMEAEDYIDKPIKPTELLARIEKQLRKKRR
jgi:putative two-component system response regulator